jgi:hypothetical protein
MQTIEKILKRAKGVDLPKAIEKGGKVVIDIKKRPYANAIDGLEKRVSNELKYLEDNFKIKELKKEEKKIIRYTETNRDGEGWAECFKKCNQERERKTLGKVF